MAGVIYTHRISDKRFGRIAGWNFKIFHELCGETSLKNVVLATNMWGEVSRDVGEARWLPRFSNQLPIKMHRWTNTTTPNDPHMM